MQAGCKIFLNHSGMTHISLVLMFTYVKAKRKLRTDGAVSLLLSQHALFFFSGQDHSYVCTAAIHWCSGPERRCTDGVNQTKYPQDESQSSLLMGKWKNHLFEDSKVEVIFIARGSY